MTEVSGVLGIVKWFQGGFGFVTNFETKEDVFVHHTGITTTVDCWKILYPGEYVYFTVGSMEDGKTQALNVTGVMGGPLRCETLSLLKAEREEHNRENGRPPRAPRQRRRQGSNTASTSDVATADATTDTTA